MRESHGPVDRMAAALERMMRALARHARALERLRRDHGAEQLKELEQCREALEHEIAICIESLQFHDRLMQQLAQVRAGLAALGGGPHAPVEMHPPEGSAGSVELF